MLPLPDAVAADLPDLIAHDQGNAMFIPPPENGRGEFVGDLWREILSSEGLDRAMDLVGEENLSVSGDHTKVKKKYIEINSKIFVFARTWLISQSFDSPLLLNNT